MDPKISSTTDKLIPPLVPVRTVFPSSLNQLSVQNGGETAAISRKVPTKMIPVNLKPMSSIFDNIDDEKISPVCLNLDGPKAKDVGAEVRETDSSSVNGARVHENVVDDSEDADFDVFYSNNENVLDTLELDDSSKVEVLQNGTEDVLGNPEENEDTPGSNIYIQAATDVSIVSSLFLQF